jgi:hypothetical protein
MALPRKDVRATVEHDIHGALAVYADIDHLTVAEYVEKLIVADISKRVAAHIEADAPLRDLGLIRKNPDKSGNP